jgi:stearoyl-CoA desaturase (delta-9 desaturase)
MPARTDAQSIDWRSSVPFLVFHLVPVAAVVTGVTAADLVLAGVLYVTRVFFITAGYHRYFSHRSYRLGRPAQLVMAFGGLTAVQKGPLWWAATHRTHHRWADTDRDPHSPLKGFWWSHVGWVMSTRYDRYDPDAVADLARFPELRFLDRHDWIGPWALALTSYLVGGWSGLVVGFFGSTVVLWHATFAVNSVAHLVGRRRYATRDTSRNSVAVALLTMGEGWHNNHHHYPTSARQGFAWYELDVTFLVLRVLALVRVVHDLREPPASARHARQVRRGHLDVGMLRMHLARAAATVAPSDESASPRRQMLESITGLAHRASRERSAAASGRDRLPEPAA